MTIEQSQSAEFIAFSEAWTSEKIDIELAARTLIADEEGNIDGYELVGELQANFPHADFRQGKPWLQVAVENYEDVGFARFKGGSQYAAYVPEIVPPAKTGLVAKIGSSVAGLLRK